MTEDEIEQLHATSARLKSLTAHPEPGLFAWRMSLAFAIDDILNVLHGMQNPRVSDMITRAEGERR